MYWNLIHKFLSGQCTETERKKVEQWLAKDPDHQRFLNAMQKIWDVEPREERNVDVKKAWKHFRSEKMQPKHKDRRQNIHAWGSSRNKRQRWHQKTYVRSAAAAVAILVAVFFVIQKVEKNAAEITFQQIVTNKGEKNSLKLSDGTRVRLNAESVLKIPSNYGSSTRKLYLMKGEAFFEVKHNPSKPFRVYSRGVYTKDVGTKFNIRAFPEDSTITVVVAEGKVALGSTKNKNQPPVLLSTKDRAVVSKGGAPDVKHVSDLSSYIGWTQGKMIFNNAPLKEVTKQLERWYGVECLVKNKKLLNRKLTATFEGEPLSNVLKLISRSMDIEASIKGQTAIFNFHNTNAQK